MKSCSFFFYNYQDPGELKGVCMGVLELPLAFLSRINNSLIFSLSCQLIIPHFSADSTENVETDAQCISLCPPWGLFGRSFSLHRVFFNSKWNSGYKI